MTSKKGNYLLLHRSGAITQTKTLQSNQPIAGITAIINLDTLEQYKGESWEKIPKGFKSLLIAEQEMVEDEQEEYDEEEEVIFQTGAKRHFDPNLVWTYARSKL